METEKVKAFLEAVRKKAKNTKNLDMENHAMQPKAVLLSDVEALAKQFLS
jgi:hypothetical protein